MQMINPIYPVLSTGDAITISAEVAAVVMRRKSMLLLELPSIPPFATGRFFEASRESNDGNARLIDDHLKHIDHKENNGFFACLRGIHQNNSYSVPG